MVREPGMKPQNPAPDDDVKTGVGPKLPSRSPQSDPRTGEVPAGPGDAGLQARPVVNKGSPGTAQMSNRRLGIVLGIVALFSVIMLIFLTLV